MKRGRNQRRRPGGGNPNRALDSNGPEVRIRGTANQIYDKYVALARDASTSGDRVKAESYLQHAEHYFRVIRATQPSQPNQQATQGSSDGNEQPSVDNGEDRGGDQNNDRQSDRGSDRNNDRNQDRNRGRSRDDNAKRNGARQKDDAPENVEEAKAAEPAAPTSNDDDVVEEKPKRKRAPRKSVKRAAKEDKDATATDTPAVVE